ncbi:uncharacterized protein B0H18DRAFT_959344 [Fomitopsis serialis]|uniref:uncharacterized protein n=1 Tax=Fomitopsis serialis TaxID=139415 RepID=UPI002007BDFA|nr:uncharacterized protein B0H18DRAFT_959344 [Neoantrodia serialis]KAH9915351.1 hypothetical protein B0H18DRAFT_959344 [Neoantrodia serialis]
MAKLIQTQSNPAFAVIFVFVREAKIQGLRLQSASWRGVWIWSSTRIGPRGEMVGKVFKYDVSRKGMGKKWGRWEIMQRKTVTSTFRRVLKPNALVLAGQPEGYWRRCHTPRPAVDQIEGHGVALPGTSRAYMVLAQSWNFDKIVQADAQHWDLRRVRQEFPCLEITSDLGRDFMTAPYASPQALTSFTGELVKSQVMAWKGFSAVSTYPPTSPNFFASDTGRNSVLLNFLHHHLPGYPQVPIHISNTDPVVQHLRTNAEDLGIASEDIVIACETC